MSELRRYPDYKDSGVPWLGEIPSHWDEKRMRFFVNTNPLKSELDVANDTMVSFLPMEALSVDGGMNLDTNKEIGEVYKGYTYFRDDDVVIAKITPCFENGKASISRNLTNGIGFGTTELHVLRPKDDAISKFIFYLIRSDSFMKVGESEMYGAGGQKRIPESFIKNFLGALPPLDEQQAIVNFLDNELAHIDTLIDKQQQLIEKLAEQRSAVITHAVTKGLDPNVPMKDSGVEWLGEIPEHWDAKSLRFVIDNIVTGSTPPSNLTEYYDETDPIDWFNPSDFKTSSILLNSKKKISRKSVDDNVVKLIPENSVLIIGIGATLGKVGIVNYACTTNQQVNSITLKDSCDSKFIMYVLKAQLEIMKLFSSSSTLGILNQEKTKSLILSIAPLDEQKKIANYLDNETQKIDKMSKATREIIAKLQEYRSALITQAVTGKIDVRDIAKGNRIEEMA